MGLNIVQADETTAAHFVSYRCRFHPKRDVFTRATQREAERGGAGRVASCRLPDSMLSAELDSSNRKNPLVEKQSVQQHVAFDDSRGASSTSRRAGDHTIVPHRCVRQTAVLSACCLDAACSCCRLGGCRGLCGEAPTHCRRSDASSWPWRGPSGAGAFGALRSCKSGVGPAAMIMSSDRKGTTSARTVEELTASPSSWNQQSGPFTFTTGREATRHLNRGDHARRRRLREGTRIGSQHPTECCEPQ